MLPIASPFTEARRAPNDFVLIPSRGSFISSDHSTIENLHLGITNHAGEVTSFDFNGICYEKGFENRWSECLSLNFIQKLSQDQSDIDLFNLFWSSSLAELISVKRTNYHPVDNNCFDFGLEMITILTRKLKEANNRRLCEVIQILDQVKCDKVSFCQNFVVERTKLAALYLCFHRKLGHLPVVCSS